MAPLVSVGVLKFSDCTEAYSLNLAFTNPNIRIHCDRPLKMVKEAEKVETSKAIVADRKAFVDASVVRIMKARKRMSHKDLVAETINLCKARFTPDVKEIKVTSASFPFHLFFSHQFISPFGLKFSEIH